MIPKIIAIYVTFFVIINFMLLESPSVYKPNKYLDLLSWYKRYYQISHLDQHWLRTEIVFSCFPFAWTSLCLKKLIMIFFFTSENLWPAHPWKLPVAYHSHQITLKTFRRLPQPPNHLENFPSLTTATKSPWKLSVAYHSHQITLKTSRRLPQPPNHLENFPSLTTATKSPWKLPVAYHSHQITFCLSNVRNNNRCDYKKSIKTKGIR